MVDQTQVAKSQVAQPQVTMITREIMDKLIANGQVVEVVGSGDDIIVKCVRWPNKYVLKQGSVFKAIEQSRLRLPEKLRNKTTVTLFMWNSVFYVAKWAPSTRAYLKSQYAAYDEMLAKRAAQAAAQVAQA